MTTENKETTDPLDQAIKNIDSKLEEKFKQTEDKFEKLTQNLSSQLNSFREEPKETKKSWEEEGEDDSYVTRGTLKNVLRDIVTEVKEETNKSAEKIFESKMNKTTRDVQIFDDFPESNRKSKNFNPKFLQEIEAEMVAKVKRGRNPDDHDLMYDSAEAVWNRWVRLGKTLPRHLIERNNEKENANEDSFNLDPIQESRSTKPNENQIALAQKFGLSKERITQLMDNKRKI